MTGVQILWTIKLNDPLICISGNFNLDEQIIQFFFDWCKKIFKKIWKKWENEMRLE